MMLTKNLLRYAFAATLLSACACTPCSDADQANAPAAPNTSATTRELAQSEYAIVMQTTGGELAPWQQQIAEALKAKHAALKPVMITYETRVGEVRGPLMVAQPKYTAFVVEPGKGGMTFTVEVSRMCRALDDDPYFDTFWSVMTGYTTDDILMLANDNKPLAITRTCDCTGKYDLKHFTKAWLFDENARGQYTYYDKAANETKVVKGNHDSTDDFVNMCEGQCPQLFITSAHASEKDWAMGYKENNMGVYCMKGKILAMSIDERHMPLDNQDPKVWLASGNCLIGNVLPNDKECMINAMVHAFGVRQMVGYTVPTWFGRMGWGVSDLFDAVPGLYNVTEAFHFQNTAIVEELRLKYPKYLNETMPTYDIESLQYIPQYHFKDPNMPQENLGLLFDRDAVCLYGDPAYEARIANDNVPVAVTQSVSGKNLTVTVEAKGDVKALPENLFIALRATAFKPEVEKSDFANAIVNERFIYLPKASDVLKNGKKAVIEVKFEKVPENPEHVVNILSLVKDFSKGAGLQNGPSIIMADAKAALTLNLWNLRADRIASLRAELEKIKSDEERFYMLYTVAYMPPCDYDTIKWSLLAENAHFAAKVRHEAPWKADLTDDLFLNYVLPYTCLNEKRDPWRKLLYETFKDSAYACASPSDAVKMLNVSAFKTLNVQYHATLRPKPNQSVKESVDAHYASCTGLSVILAESCRACGIPARFVGCPLWTDRSGNHNWVEYWDNQWLFEGASKSDPRNNDWVGERVKMKTNPNVWFNSVIATSTRPTTDDEYFVQVWDSMDTSYPALPVTQFYTDDNQVTLPISEDAQKDPAAQLWVYYRGEPCMVRKVEGQKSIRVFIPRAFVDQCTYFFSSNGKQSAPQPLR